MTIIEKIIMSVYIIANVIFIWGMSLASMITSDCELIGIGMEISQDKAGE